MQVTTNMSNGVMHVELAIEESGSFALLRPWLEFHSKIHLIIEEDISFVVEVKLVRTSKLI